jgi:hypothetical protein
MEVRVTGAPEGSALGPVGLGDFSAKMETMSSAQAEEVGKASSHRSRAGAWRGMVACVEAWGGAVTGGGGSGFVKT